MLAKLFNNISIQSLIRALLFSVLMLSLGWFFMDINQNPLQLLAWQWHVPVLMAKSLLSVVLIASCWWFNSKINDLGFLKEDYQLIPVMMLLLVPIFFKATQPELLLVLPLGILLHIRIFQLIEATDPSFILFDSGVLISLMALFLPQSLFLLLILWLAVLNFGHLTVRTFLMPAIGVLATFFMVFTVLYWIFDFNAMEVFFDRLMTSFTLLEWPYLEDIGIYSPLLLLALPAILETAQIYGKASVKKRQIFTFLTTTFLIILLMGLFVKNKGAVWIWLTLPYAIFTTNLIHYIKKAWLRDMVYLVLIVFLVFHFLL